MLSQSNNWRMSYRCWRYRCKSEVPSISFVRNANLEGKTLLDIGANRGIYSIYMSRAAGENGRVIAFEPQPELKAHLETIKRSFRLSNLEIENIGRRHFADFVATLLLAEVLLREFARQIRDRDTLEERRHPFRGFRRDQGGDRKVRRICR